MYLDKLWLDVKARRSAGEGLEGKWRAALPFLDPIISHPFPTVI